MIDDAKTLDIDNCECCDIDIDESDKVIGLKNIDVIGQYIKHYNKRYYNIIKRELEGKHVYTIKNGGIIDGDVILDKSLIANAFYKKSLVETGEYSPSEDDVIINGDVVAVAFYEKDKLDGINIVGGISTNRNIIAHSFSEMIIEPDVDTKSDELTRILKNGGIIDGDVIIDKSLIANAFYRNTNNDHEIIKTDNDVIINGNITAVAFYEKDKLDGINIVGGISTNRNIFANNYSEMIVEDDIDAKSDSIAKTIKNGGIIYGDVILDKSLIANAFYRNTNDHNELKKTEKDVVIHGNITAVAFYEKDKLDGINIVGGISTNRNIFADNYSEMIVENNSINIDDIIEENKNLKSQLEDLQSRLSVLESK